MDRPNKQPHACSITRVLLFHKHLVHNFTHLEKYRFICLLIFNRLVCIDLMSAFLHIFHFKSPYFSWLKFPNLSVDFQIIFNINGSHKIFSALYLVYSNTMHTRNIFVPSRNYWHAHVLHVYALQFLVLYNIIPLCITAIWLWIKREHGCTWINRDLLAQNWAFLVVVPVISRPNVQFKTSSVVAEKPWHEMSWWRKICQVQGFIKRQVM